MVACEKERLTRLIYCTLGLGWVGLVWFGLKISELCVYCRSLVGRPSMRNHDISVCVSKELSIEIIIRRRRRVVVELKMKLERRRVSPCLSVVDWCGCRVICSDWTGMEWRVDHLECKAMGKPFWGRAKGPYWIPFCEPTTLHLQHCNQLTRSSIVTHSFSSLVVFFANK